MQLRLVVVGAAVMVAGVVVPAAPASASVEVQVETSTMRQFRCAEDPCLELVSEGEPIAVLVRVSASPSDTPVEGTVSLVEDGHEVGSGEVDPETARAVATIDEGLPAGTHHVTVEYSGDDNAEHPAASWFRSFEIEVLDAPGTGAYQRISGVDRFETAAAMSADVTRRPDFEHAAVVARADDPSDALCASASAARLKSPLLLTDRENLSDETRAELIRSKPVQVGIAGGTAAVSEHVADEIRSLGLSVRRTAGADRFETCAASHESSPTPVVILATARNAADALAASAAAVPLGAVILLTDGDRLPDATAEYIDEHAEFVIAVGGPAARAFPDADEVIAGRDRYETAALLADYAFDDVPFVGVASGTSWADALAGGPHIAVRGRGPLLLVSDAVPQSVADFLETRRDTTIAAFVYGGSAAVSDAVAADVAGRLGR